MTDKALAHLKTILMHPKVQSSLLISGTINGAIKEIERLEAELSYAYQCVDAGFTHGTFDFSVLRKRAWTHVAKLENTK